jgi:beta-glucanase (GH16 family)
MAMQRSVFSKRVAAAVAALLCLSAETGSSDRATLDLSKFKLVFSDDFKHLDVSPYGPGTVWKAHTPWYGDFGDAKFADPSPGFPFDVANGVFRIEMRKTPDGKWESGLLATKDPYGGGFQLRYGYFELRAKLPAGPGVWPAFWLGSESPKGSLDPGLEVDVFEAYGKFPAAYNSTVTVWPKIDKAHRTSSWKQIKVPPGSLSAAFHSYGVAVMPDWITFYLDGAETWRVKTPEEHKLGLGILIDLGLGAGWPIDHAPNPSYLEIQYVRAYAPKNLPAG